MLLTGFQGWLGGRVVAHELAAWIVTAHLVVALVIVQMLLYVTVTAEGAGHTAEGVTNVRDPAPIGVRVSAAGLILLTLVQVGVGAQVRGAIDGALDAGVDRSAVVATLGSIDVIHRDLAFLVLIGAALLTMWLLYRRSPQALQRWSLVTLSLAILQVALGVFTVLHGAPWSVAIVHQLGAVALFTLIIRARFAALYPKAQRIARG